MSTKKIETFENLRTKGFVFQSSPGHYPTPKDIFQTTDDGGMAGFSPNINCQTATVGDFTATTGTAVNLTAANATFSSVNSTGPITTTSNLLTTNGYISAGSLKLRDQSTIQVSNSKLQWNAIDLNGWVPLLTPAPAPVAPLANTASVSDVAAAVNNLINVCKTKRVFIV